MGDPVRGQPRPLPDRPATFRPAQGLPRILVGWRPGEQAHEHQIALARSGRFAEVADQQFPLLIHPSRQSDPAVRSWFG